jgi:hypothetical protein
MALRYKHRAFIDAFFRNNLNGTAAYKEAYGVEDDNHAAVNASKLLRIAKIREAVDLRLKENQMGADEVLFRIREQSENPAARFFDEDGGFDFEACREAGMMHLIKSVSVSDSSGDKGSSHSLKVELVDPQAALFKVGSHHKLFTEKFELDATLNIEGLTNILNGIYGQTSDDQS